MRYACAPSLVGMASPVLFAFKTAKFLWTVVHGGQKKDCLKKSMQVEVDVKTCTKFGGCGFLVQTFNSFLFAFKTSKFSFWTMDYSPWGSKNTIIIPVNFCIALFSRISWILLSREIKFRKSVAMPHLLCCPYRSSTKIFFAKLLKLPFLRRQNFPVYGRISSKNSCKYRSHPPNLVHMHISLASTSINFFNQFYFFLWTIVLSSKRKFKHDFKAIQFSSLLEIPHFVLSIFLQILQRLIIGGIKST